MSFGVLHEGDGLRGQATANHTLRTEVAEDYGLDFIRTQDDVFWFFLFHNGAVK